MLFGGYVLARPCTHVFSLAGLAIGVPSCWSAVVYRKLHQRLRLAASLTALLSFAGWLIEDWRSGPAIFPLIRSHAIAAPRTESIAVTFLWCELQQELLFVAASAPLQAVTSLIHVGCAPSPSSSCR